MKANLQIAPAVGWGRRLIGPLSALLGVAALAGAGLAWKNWSEPSEATSSGAVESPAEAAADGKSDEPEVVKLSPEVMRKYGVGLGTAKKRKLASSVVAPARLAFNGEATAIVGTPLQGRVVEIKVRSGDHVVAGAELLVIESSELGEAQSDYLQKRTAVTTAESAIGPLTGIYTRAKRLYDENQLISITELQKREIDLRQAEGALASATAARSAAANKLHLLGMDTLSIDALAQSGTMNPRYVIKSPLAGQVIERNVNLGELVKPDHEKLFLVTDTSTLWVWADVPESRAREIVPGAAAQVSLSTVMGRTFPGVVSHIAPSIDSQTRSLRVRVEVKSDPALKSGMFAQLEISGRPEEENAEPILAVPETAIQSVDGSTAVFVPVKGTGNAFQARLISVGVYLDGYVSVISGLEPGEPIVVSGSAILKADLLKASAKDDD